MTRTAPPPSAADLERAGVPAVSLAADLSRTAEFAAAQPLPPAIATWRASVLVAALAWLVVGAIITLVRANSFIAQGVPTPWRTALPSTLLFTGTWLLLLPVLLRAVVQWPLERPWRRWVVARRAVLLAGAVTVIAAAQVIVYVWLAVRFTGVVSIVNLQTAYLDLAGRFEENLVIGAVTVLLWSWWRHRQIAAWRDLQAAYLAAELSASRLQSLGMELRPHFLFNTLNAITGMVWADQATAEQMILQLSELLRRTLEDGRTPTCSLAEEREVLELYLAIQRIRFGARLTLRVDVPDDTLTGELPRFLLQPLVENAFQHGLSRKPGPVTLEVRARRDGAQLVLEVEDDGAGLPADGTITESTGVGNSRRRLATLYGDAAALTLVARPAGGAVSRVVLPWRAYSGPVAVGAVANRPAEFPSRSEGV